MNLDQVADELYSLDPVEFVGARTARAAAARDAGDRALASAIGRLRKPTTVAWLVNILARDLPEDIASLLRLGDVLGDAQRRGSAADLGRLSAQRRKMVHELTRRAVSLAADRGRQVSEDALRDLGQSLHAALSDSDVAEQVRAGRMVTAASYSGFGPAGLQLVPEIPTTTPEAAKEKTESADRGLAARADLEAATSALTDARRAAESGHAAVELAASRAAEVEARIGLLRGELERAAQERHFARSAQAAAVEAAQHLDEDLEGARRRAAAAERTLGDLG